MNLSQGKHAKYKLVPIDKVFEKFQANAVSANRTCSFPNGVHMKFFVRVDKVTVREWESKFLSSGKSKELELQCTTCDGRGVIVKSRDPAWVGTPNSPTPKVDDVLFSKGSAVVVFVDKTSAYVPNVHHKEY